MSPSRSHLPRSKIESGQRKGSFFFFVLSFLQRVINKSELYEFKAGVIRARQGACRVEGLLSGRVKSVCPGECEYET